MRPSNHLASVAYQDLPFDTWRSLWLDYLASGKAEHSEAVHRHTYDRIAQSSSSLRGFVVASDGEPIGFVHYYFHPSSYALNEACMIEDLYVSPDAHGQGVGRWLIEQVAAIAAAQSATTLHWKTSVKNTSAIALYRTLAKQDDVLVFRRPL